MTIYLVEDDPIYAEFISKALGQNPEYTITWFSSAEKCLPVSQKTLPDALIVDYKLPGMDGVELYKTLQSQLKDQNKYIIMSAIEDGNMVLNFIKQGIRDYVIKDEHVLNSLIAILEGKEDEYYLFS